MLVDLNTRCTVYYAYHQHGIVTFKTLRTATIARQVQHDSHALACVRHHPTDDLQIIEHQSHSIQ